MEHGGSVNACDVDIFYLYVYLFVLVCGGVYINTLYPPDIAVSTGAF